MAGTANMRLLFDDKLAPITSEIGFLEAPLEAAAQAFRGWQAGIFEPRGVSVDPREETGTLKNVLLSLLPLTSVRPRRYLFVPTSSHWVAFFDNGHQGTDVFSTVSYLAKRIGCRGLRVAAIPDTIQGEFKEARGRYGGLILEVYGPKPNPILNYVRTISVINDGGRWDFDQSGTPFPFEEMERYRARRIRDRFSFEMLESYLAKLGLRPFEEDFYLPGSTRAVRIELNGNRPPGMREFSLEEARRGY